MSTLIRIPDELYETIVAAQEDGETIGVTLSRLIGNSPPNATSDFGLLTKMDEKLDMILEKRQYLKNVGTDEEGHAVPEKNNSVSGQMPANSKPTGKMVVETTGATPALKAIRTAQQITAEINQLQAEINAADPMNQDPDYWEVINDKKTKVQDLWAEWHTIQGR